MSRKTIIVVAVAALLFAAAIIIYAIASNARHSPSHIVMSEEVARMASTATSSPLKPPRAPPAGFKEYRNEKHRFALFYPEDLSVTEYDEGWGAATVAFENKKKQKAFQIFVTPDDGTEISEGSLRRGERSGSIENRTEVTIGGAPAVAFYGKDSRVGDTTEVRFLHGGYIFEAATIKEQHDFLNAALSTWEFL